MLGILDGYRANGIELPCPQRDLHLKTPAEIKVSLTSNRRAAGVRGEPGRRVAAQ
jgi:small-conductance mechanosensitive channel